MIFKNWGFHIVGRFFIILFFSSDSFLFHLTNSDSLTDWKKKYFFKFLLLATKFEISVSSHELNRLEIALEMIDF